MTSPLECFVASNDVAGWTPAEGDGPIEDYLDALCVPLAAVLPPGEVNDFRRLAREHIEEIAGEFAAQGLPWCVARRAALAEHGNARQIGAELAREWSRGDPARGRKPAVRRSALHALVLLGVLSILAPFLLAFANPANGVMGAGIMPLFFALSVLAGGVSGALAVLCRDGRTLVPAAVLLLAQAAAPIALFLPGAPLQDCMFALLVFWLPPGALCAVLTAHRLRRFSKVAGS